MPGRLNLKIYKGETFRHVLIWKDSNEVPINLNGYTARMHVRKKIVDPDPPVLVLTTENGGIAIDVSTGKITLKLTSIQTKAITWYEAFYDLELIVMDGPEEVVTRLVEGRVLAFDEVTRE